MNINYPRDFSVDISADIRNITANDICPRCKSKDSLKFSKGIEVGHTFKLGTKYSKSMNATFLDENNKEQFFIMGCYGIGVSRIVAAAIEQNYDEDGIIWYPTIAPFTVYVLPIDYKDEEIKKVADKVYEILNQNNIEVLLDDRDERPGVKFKDADLIGIPIRLTVSKRLLPDKVELYLRQTKQTSVISINELVEKVKESVVYLMNF
jgi:prolyl-tRNA synthetase